MRFRNFVRKIEGLPEIEEKKHHYVYPQDVEIEYLERVLRGEIPELSSAFTWDSTPQGYEYWANRSTRRVELTSDDWDYLNWIAEEYHILVKEDGLEELYFEDEEEDY